METGMKEKKQKELLLKLRGKVQGAYHVQPFKVMTDAMVDAIVAAQPRSLDEVKRVKGFPEGKFRNEKFGKAVVTIIRHWDEIEDIELVGSQEQGYDVSIAMKPSSVFGGK